MKIGLIAHYGEDYYKSRVDFLDFLDKKVNETYAFVPNDSYKDKIDALNNKVDKNVIIQENSRISRIEESTGKIFIAHDTTYIDYKKHKKNGILDKIFSSGKEKEGNLGLILHNSLALTASGIPLGVIN